MAGLAPLFSNPEQPLVRTLSRLAQRASTGCRGLELALQSRLPELLESALEVATDTEGPLGVLLAQAVRHAPDPGLAGRVLRWLERQPLGDPLPLQELALVANERVISRRLCRTSPPTDAEQFVDLWLMRRCAARLRQADRSSDALELGRRALGQLRQLVETNPTLFGEALAEALRDVTQSLIWLDQHVEAEHMARQAITAFRSLQAQGTEVNGSLAGSLELSGVALSALGRHAEALENTSEAATLRHELRLGRSARALGPADVTSLHLLSARLASLGHWQSAQVAAAASVEAARNLADERRLAVLPRLAEHLNQLAIQRYELGNVEESTELAREAVEILRLCVRTRPEAYRTRLAGLLSNLAALLADLGSFDLATQLAEEATASFRELGGRRPEGSFEGLTRSLQNLALRLQESGRVDESLQLTTEALRLRLAGHSLETPAAQGSLADSLEFHALQLRDHRRYSEALPLLVRAVELRQRLADEALGVFGSALVRGLVNLARVHYDLNDFLAAARVTDAAVEASERCLRHGHPLSRCTLGQALSIRGVLLHQLGQTSEALKTQRRLHRMLMAESTKQPRVFRIQLAMNLENMASSLSSLGFPKAAVRNTRRAIGFWRELARENQLSTQRDLVRALHNLAHHQGLAGQKRAAVRSGEEAVRIYRDLSHRTAQVFEAELVDSLHNLANQYTRALRWAEAVRASRQAFVLTRSLAARAPDLFTEARDRAQRFLERRISLARQHIPRSAKSTRSRSPRPLEPAAE